MAGFRRAFRAVMRGYFGRAWLTGILILSALTFWPLIVFREHLQFKASGFAVEWVKSGVVGLLVVLTIEILNYRRMASAALLHLRESFEVRFLLPVRNMRYCLEHLLAADNTSTTGVFISKRDELRHRWDLLMESFEVFTSDSSLGAEVSVDLRMIKSGVKHRKVNSLLRELGTSLSTAERRDLGSLVADLERLQEKLEIALKSALLERRG